MKEVLINDLSLEDLMSLINQGERIQMLEQVKAIYYPNTILQRRDAFWFEETPVAEQPIRKASHK